MTVKQLIQELSKFDPDIPVTITEYNGCDDYLYEIKTIQQVEDSFCDVNGYSLHDKILIFKTS